MESFPRAAHRATLSGLHASCAFGGLVGVLAWLGFGFRPAAIVSGAAWLAAGLLALLARRSPVCGFTRRIAIRGALLLGYGTALLALGGLLLGRGTRS